MKELYQLFASFFRIGAFTFGGGYAMLPLLQKEVVDKHAWASQEELMDYFAVGQVTPGVIAVNTATFIGYKRRKTLGALSATLGVILPSILIILAVAAFLTAFTDNPLVNHAFRAIRACVCVQILEAVIQLAKNALTDRWTWLIFISVALLAYFSVLSSIALVLLAGLAGVLICCLRAKGGKC